MKFLSPFFFYYNTDENCSRQERLVITRITSVTWNEPRVCTCKYLNSYLVNAHVLFISCTMRAGKLETKVSFPFSRDRPSFAGVYKCRWRRSTVIVQRIGLCFSPCKPNLYYIPCIYLGVYVYLKFWYFATCIFMHCHKNACGVTLIEARCSHIHKESAKVCTSFKLADITAFSLQDTGENEVFLKKK